MSDYQYSKASSRVHWLGAKASLLNLNGVQPKLVRSTFRVLCSNYLSVQKVVFLEREQTHTDAKLVSLSAARRGDEREAKPHAIFASNT